MRRCQLLFGLNISMIYIFGGSLTEDKLITDSWPTMLAQTFQVTNLSIPSASNSYIFLKFSEIAEQLTSDDVVIVAWQTYTRPYINLTEINKLSINDRYEHLDYYQRFFTLDSIDRLHYETYLKMIKQICKEKSVKLIALWGSPTNYVPDAPVTLTNSSTFTYATTFDNEIRPALIYFSEIERAKLPLKEAEEYTHTDPRPNHIEDRSVHNKIYNAVSDFINNKAKGLVSLL